MTASPASSRATADRTPGTGQVLIEKNKGQRHGVRGYPTAKVK